jgi:probable HAF family extracellular repeat protein
MKIFPLIAGAIWPLLLSTAFGQTQYAIFRIPGNEAVAVDMNNLGAIVGNYSAPDGTSHAFLYFFGQFFDLTTSFKTPGPVVAINNAEQITGSYVAADGTQHTFLQSLRTKKVTDVGQGTPTAMNDRGEVVGWGYRGSQGLSVNGGFIYRDGQQSYIGPAATRPDMLYYGDCINNRGQIAVGVGSEISDVYLYSSGTFTNIGSALLPFAPFHGDFTAAFAINEHGQVTGISGTNWGYTTGFLYSGGSFISLGWCLPGYSDHSINNAGQIVGTNVGPYYGPRTPPVAFLYTEGQTVDLNRSIPSNSGIVLTDAVAINDARLIVANGYSKSGSIMGSAAYYLLVPFPVRFAPMHLESNR